MSDTTVRNRLATISPEPLAEHAIHLFYKIDELEHAQPKLALFKDVPSPSGTLAPIPKDQIEAFSGRYGTNAIWERDANATPGPDLHPHVGNILAGTADELSTRWRLTPLAMRFLKSADLYAETTDRSQRIKKKMVLTLSPSARQRMKDAGIAPSDLLIEIEDASLLLFNTGHGFACVETILRRRKDDAPLSAIELLEGQIALSRFNVVTWRSDDQNDNDSAPTASEAFSLGTLLRQLVLGGTAKTRMSGRVFTYTFARPLAPTSIEARDALALYLARHYTSDYLLSSDVHGVGQVGDFDTIRHTLALEGAATIAGAESPEKLQIPFLTSFYKTTFRSHYIGAAVLAVHEHSFMVDRTGQAIHASTDKRSIAEMERLRRQSLLFRAQFRLADLSYVSLHNAIWSGLRNVFGCPDMLRQLNEDVQEMSAYLRTEQNERNAREEYEDARKTYWATMLGSASLALLTVFTIVKEGIGAFPPAKKFIEGHVMDTAALAFLAGGIVFCVSLLYGYAFRPRRGAHGGAENHDESGHFRQHAAHKTVLKSASSDKPA